MYLYDLSTQNNEDTYKVISASPHLNIKGALKCIDECNPPDGEYIAYIHSLNCSLGTNVKFVLSSEHLYDTVFQASGYIESNIDNLCPEDLVISINNKPSNVAVVIQVTVFIFASYIMLRLCGQCIKRCINSMYRYGYIETYSDRLVHKSCTICIEDFLPRERVKVLKCKHVFHIECIDKWNSIKKRCPNCNTDIEDYLLN